MTDYLSRMVGYALGTPQPVQPVWAPRFGGSPEVAIAGPQAGLHELESVLELDRQSPADPLAAPVATRLRAGPSAVSARSAEARVRAPAGQLAQTIIRASVPEASPVRQGPLRGALAPEPRQTPMSE